jgi:Tfp pilus assembly protein PilX
MNRLRQRGATLMTTLVMMILVMMLGVSAILLSKGQFNQAANIQLQAAALNQAEGAAVVAEKWLATGTNYQDSGFTTRVPGGLYPIGYMAANGLDPLTMSWSTSTASIAVTGNTNQRYIIEKLADDKKLLTSSMNVGGVAASGCNQVNVYRVITRGSASRGAQRFVQTVFSVLSC